MTPGILALAALIAVAGLFVRERRHLLERRRQFLLLGLVVLLVAGSLLTPPPGPGLLLGALVVFAAALSRDLEPRLELVWMLVMGGLLGLSVYQVGSLALLGAAASFGLVLLLGRSDEGRPTFGRFGARVKAYDRHLLVCVDGPCKAGGALRVREALSRDRRFRLANGVRVTPSGCLGYCRDGPIVWAEPEGTLYRHVEPSSLETLWSPAATPEGAPE